MNIDVAFSKDIIKAVVLILQEQSRVRRIFPCFQIWRRTLQRLRNIGAKRI